MNFQVFCDGTPVERVTNVKYLGMQMDTCLKGDVHVGHLMKVCSARLSFLYRQSSFLDFKCRRILCLALIQPHIDYCCSSWYGALLVTLKERLDVIQRKMVRFVYGLDFRQHVGKKDLRNLLWLSIPDRVAFFKMMHLFRIRHNIAPTPIPRYPLKERQNCADLRPLSLHSGTSKLLKRTYNK